MLGLSSPQHICLIEFGELSVILNLKQPKNKCKFIGCFGSYFNCWVASQRVSEVYTYVSAKPQRLPLLVSIGNILKWDYICTYAFIHNNIFSHLIVKCCSCFCNLHICTIYMQYIYFYIKTKFYFYFILYFHISHIYHVLFHILRPYSSTSFILMRLLLY